MTGLGPKTTHDTILFYFENPRQSGGEVKKVEYDDGDTVALVFFEEPSGLLLETFCEIHFLILFKFNSCFSVCFSCG